MGGVENIEINISSMKIVANFYLIQILDENDLEPTLLGIKWAYDYDVIINLKHGICPLRIIMLGWCNLLICIRESRTHN